MIDKIIEEYVESNQGTKPSHIHLHPKLFKDMLMQEKDILMQEKHYIKLNNKPNFAFKSVENRLIYVHRYGESVISFVDRREIDDFIIVGNERAYSDYVMEKELLGDHS